MLARRTWIAGAIATAATAADSPWTIVRRPDDATLIADLSAGEGILAAVAGPKALLSLDEGVNWTRADLPDRASSIFALSPADLWLVGAEGLWHSTDAGAGWKRRLEQTGLERVYFLNPEHGFACGAGRTILESADGGESWKRVAAADEPDTAAAYTVYHWIHFVTPRAGIITGTSRPPRRGNTGVLPAWRDPLAHVRRREWPGASITLETRDAGGAWKHSTTSLFGRISRVRYSRDGHGLAVVEFHDAFEWPSEVFGINIRTGETRRVFREKNRAVTDAVIFSGSDAYLAAVEPPANPSESNLGALRVLHSGDSAAWAEVELPEELPAGRAFFAPSGRQLFLATDTGYVLKLR